MKLLFSTLIFLTAPFATGVESPQIINTTNRQEVKLGVDVENALKAYDPAFKIMPMSKYAPEIPSLFKDYPNELPMAVIGDFNGNGLKNDIAVMGYVADTVKVVMVIFEKSKYKAFEAVSIKSNSFSSGKPWIQYLGRADKRELQAMEFTGNQDMLKLEVHMAGTSLYVFKNNRVNKFEVE